MSFNYWRFIYNESNAFSFYMTFLTTLFIYATVIILLQIEVIPVMQTRTIIVILKEEVKGWQLVSKNILLFT